VMATHDLRLASRIAHHVVFLESGKVIESGRAETIFGDPKQDRTKSFISSINAAQTIHI